MALQAWQYSYNGLTLGAGTPYGVMQVTGLRDLPPQRVADVARARQDGNYAGLQFAGSRIITFTVNTIATAGLPQYEANLEAVGTAFAPVTDPTLLQPLQFYPGNLTLGRAVQVTGRPTKGGYVINKNHTIGFTDGIAVEFTCPDPLIYDSTQQTATTGLPSPTSGLAFPVSFPASFGSSTGGSVQVTNAGNYPTAPVLTINGPCTNPSVSLGSQTLRFNLTLGFGDVLTINTQAHTVTLNGASRYNTIATGSAWFTLPPGMSTVGFASTDATAVTGTLTVTYRSAWAWL